MADVKIVHKSWKPSENREPAVVEERMFETLWKDKGWKLAKEDDSPSSPPSPSPSSSSSSESSGESSGS